MFEQNNKGQFNQLFLICYSRLIRFNFSSNCDLPNSLIRSILMFELFEFKYTLRYSVDIQIVRHFDFNLQEKKQLLQFDNR